MSEYNNSYNKEKYEQMTFRVWKGEKQKVKMYALMRNQSVSSMINELLAQKIPGFEPLTDERSKK